MAIYRFFSNPRYNGIYKILLICGFTASILCAHGQSERRFSLEAGIATLPLKISRNNLTRWMIYPRFDAAYLANSRLSIVASYMYYDIRFKSYSNADFYTYSETPMLHSYEEAVYYRGKKIGLSEFSHYLFVGVKYMAIKEGCYQMSCAAQIGHRTGYTDVVANITKEANRPNGYYMNPGLYKSNGFGLKLEIIQSILIYRRAIVSCNLGNYFFKKWPSLQPSLGLSAGINL